jgi:hypothetical protein
MPSFLRRWRWRHLFATWIAYWAGLALAILWRPVSIGRGLADLPDGQASVSAEFANGLVTVKMMGQGAQVWGGSASLLVIVLWIAGPPLLLWILWVFSRSRPVAPARAAESLGVRAESDPERPVLRDGVALADHLAERPPTKEPVGTRRGRDAH